MKKIPIVLLSLLVLSCGGGDTVDPANLVGVWNATKLEFANAADLSQKVDVIPLGATFTVDLRDDGTYRAVLTPPGGTAETTTGTWTATDVLTLSENGTGGNMQFDLTLSGNTMTIDGADSEYDFDGDDVPEAAKLSGVFSRA